MIKTTEMLLDELKMYSSPKTKLSRMAKSGKIFPIVKGLYETERNTPAYLLAGSIYGPSYISFMFALSYYDLIPEKVTTVTSATFGKKKKKRYVNAFGTFTYRDVPEEAFPLGITLVNEGEYWYRIATREKALCDLLYILKPVSNVKEMRELLFDDLRIEEDALGQFNIELVNELSAKYHCINVKRFCAMLRRLKKNEQRH